MWYRHHFFLFRMRLCIPHTLSLMCRYDYISTSKCHNFMYYIVSRHRCLGIIQSTSPFKYVSSCASPFSLIYSFLTLCGCHFLCASPLLLWERGSFWRFADFAPQFLYIINSRHVFWTIFTARHLLCISFCSKACIGDTILLYVTHNNIIQLRHQILALFITVRHSQ